jgi:hypothetical protein
MSSARTGHTKAAGAGQPHSTSSKRDEHSTDPAGYLGPTPPQVAAPTWQRRVLVERPGDLIALATDLAGAHVIALDAEFAQARVRQPDEPSHRLALVQIACDNDYRVSYVVDALRIADLSPLRAAFEHPAILKVFHSIGSDARVLAARDLIARHTLDVEAVSRAIFGQQESGLQTMLQRASGVRLDKSMQRADWSRRPLTPAMVAYAARDAEMTFALYTWLAAHYPEKITLYETAADEPLPAVAEWILPYLDGARPHPAAQAVAEAGISSDMRAQEAALRQALAAVRHPHHLTRVIRLITDLELERLAPDLRPYLSAPSSEERASAARAIGRLRDRSAILEIRPLLADPVRDVRQAAHTAMEHLEQAQSVRRQRATRTDGPLKWSSDDADNGAQPVGESAWQVALRAKFGIASDSSARADDGE